MRRCLILLFSFIVCFAGQAAGSVYFNDFDGGETFSPGVTGGFTGGMVEGVQGYSAYGFANNLLRVGRVGNQTVGAAQLSLQNLPAHDSIDLNFLLAIIDSWDGNGAALGPDTFTVTVDGNSVFSQIFNNAVTGMQTYVPPPNVELVRRVDLGFGQNNLDFLDSGYNVGLDSSFSGIPHTASTLTIDFVASGPNLQFFGDESFGLENMSVVLNSAPVPEPSAILIWCIGIGVTMCRFCYKVRNVE